MTISSLPTPPSRSDTPENFITKADAFIGALPTFVTETNAVAVAMNLNATTDTSATSNTIGAGSKTFTVSTGKSFQPGMWLVIADTAAPSTNSIFAQITSYISGTGVLVVNATGYFGSGTKTSWVISQSSPGDAGSIGHLADGTGAVVTTVKEHINRVVSVLDFMTGEQRTDAKNRAYTLDLTAPIQSAVARIITLGGGAIDCRGLGIKTTAAIDLLGCNNVTFLVDGSDWRTGGGDHYTFINGNGSFATSLTYYNMTGTVSVGATSLTLTTQTNAANFVAGDYVYIRTSQDVSGLTDQPIAELNIVKTSDSSTGILTFEYPFTKDYESYSTYTHGVAKANTLVTRNIKFEGKGKFDNAGRRVFQLLHVWNLDICGQAAITGRGGVVARGKFIKCNNNEIHITPNWGVPLWRPYFFAVDTGSSDSEFLRNNCSSSGSGFVHIHEGQSNCKVEDNTLSLGVTDTAATEDWPVISIRGRSWGTTARKNKIYNSPKTDAIVITGSLIEVTKGHKYFDVTDNEFYGTCAGRHINETSATANDFLISGNKSIGSYVTNSIRVTSTDGVVCGNNVPIGSAEIAEGCVVKNNIGFCEEKKFLSFNDFSLISGAPVIGTIAAGRANAWQMDSASAEQIATAFVVPEQATKWSVKLHWTNAGAGAGDVVWFLNPQGFIDGENMDIADSTIATTIVAAPTQNYLKITPMLTNAVLATSAMAAGDTARLRIARNGAAGTDTLANDAALIGLELRFT